jgi:hypothetical protein
MCFLGYFCTIAYQKEQQTFLDGLKTANGTHEGTTKTALGSPSTLLPRLSLHPVNGLH